MFKRINFNEFNKLYEKIKLDFPPFRLRSLDEYARLLNEDKYQCFVFEIDGKEVGFISGYIFQNNATESYSRRYGYFHMDYLDIYEEYRHQGYGTKLMEELLNEPFTKKGMFYVLPMEEKYYEDKDDPYFERVGDDPYFKLKRFFDQFSQTEITHYQNDKQFVYMYPGSDENLYPMHLELIKGFHKDNNRNFEIFYDEFASLLKESEDYIHQNNPSKEKAYESYKDTIIKTTAPYSIPAVHHELLQLDVSSDKKILDIKPFVISGDNTLKEYLFNGGYVSFDVFKAMLTKNTIFNKNNIRAFYLGDNGTFFNLSAVIVLLDKYPENNKEELLKSFEESGEQLPKDFDKAINYLEEIKNRMDDGETRILFVGKGTSYYSTCKETDLVCRLPKGKTYTIEISKTDLFKIYDFAKLGFKVKKEYKDTVELYKKQ